jgi:hypothetical protein
MMFPLPQQRQEMRFLLGAASLPRKLNRRILAAVWPGSGDELPCNSGVPTRLSPETSYASTLGTP